MIPSRFKIKAYAEGFYCIHHRNLKSTLICRRKKKCYPNALKINTKVIYKKQMYYLCSTESDKDLEFKISAQVDEFSLIIYKTVG